MHQHNHQHGGETITQSFIIAIIINLGFTGVEAVFALLANSSSLLADAGHNLGDVMGLLLALMANMLSKKQATVTFSYGFKRTTILAAIINALILVIASCLISADAIYELLHPGVVSAMDVIIIASIGIVVNGASAMLFLKDKNADLNVKGAFLHLSADAVISLGVVVAAVLIYFTHWMIIDPIVSLIIVALILVAGFGLLRDSLNLVMDAVPKHIKPSAVINYLESLKYVQGAHHLHIWALSTRENALTVHLTALKPLDNQTYRIINEALKVKFNIHHATIQTEAHEGDDSECKIF